MTLFMHSASEALVILERRKSVQELCLRGKKQYEIARDLGISRRTVIRDLKIIVELDREWIKERQGAYLWEEIAKLNRWEAEANDAWEHSKKDAESRTAKRIKMPVDRDEQGNVIPSGVRFETSKRVKSRCGDVRYLTKARKCAEQRCRLLGLFANKAACATPSGGDRMPSLEVMVVAVLAARTKIKADANATENGNTLAPSTIGAGTPAPT